MTKRATGNGGRERGTVKRVIADKGFGFIAGESGDEYFFHRSSCTDFDGIREGVAVTFTPGHGSKGPRAEAVTLA